MSIEQAVGVCADRHDQGGELKRYGRADQYMSAIIRRRSAVAAAAVSIVLAIAGCAQTSVPAKSVDGERAAQLTAARAAYEREDYTIAFPLFRQLVEAPASGRPDPDAAYRLGLMYRFGWGTERDVERGARWIAVAAEQGQAEAQAELGRLYLDGRGVAQDDAVAARWLLKAAQAGVGIAQLNIGRLYRDGRGVAPDVVEAHAWFSAAAANGYMDALSYRSQLVAEMTPAQIKAADAKAALRLPVRPAGAPAGDTAR